MEEVKKFIKSLSEGGFKRVVVDNGVLNCFVKTENLQKEIEDNFGVIEIVDTYCEDLSFISNNGELIEIHGFY